MDAGAAVPRCAAPGDATRIYLIDDDPTMLQFVRQTLLRRPAWQLLGHSVSLSHARSHALASSANVFLVALSLPDGRGEELLQRLACCKPHAERLVFTAFGEESRLLGALQAGATGYVLKGCASAELVAAIEQIRDGAPPIAPLLAGRLLRHLRASASAGRAAPRDGPGDAGRLSERETEALQWLAQGYANKEIAARMKIAPTTVGSHVKNIYRKLAVRSRVQLVREAQVRGLL